MTSMQGNARIVATSTTDACGPPRMIFAREFIRLISCAKRSVSGYELQIELNPKMSEESVRRCWTTNGKKNAEEFSSVSRGAPASFGTLPLSEGRLLSHLTKS